MSEKRFQVIAWQRGSYSVVDTSYPIGDPKRRDGVGYKLRREAERVAARKNREHEDGRA